jgi:prepilin-type N-terminal cleavage/methylation domain-containing protein
MSVSSHNPRVRPSRGFTLVEVSVVGVLLVLLASMAIPIFTRAMDQTRVDHAGARLQAIWTGQRLYWLANRTYADSLADLENNGFLDLMGTAQMGGLEFDYSIASADSDSFSATAEPTNSGRWSGTLSINQTGVVQGGIQRSGGAVMIPGFQ